MENDGCLRRKHVLSEIYNKLMDDESKRIFKSRLLYSLTGEYREIKNIVYELKEAKEIRQKIQKFGNGKAVLWGTGFWGTALKKTFSDIEWECYVDNAKKESIKNGIPVYFPNEYLEKYRESVVVIASTFYHDEIYQQLLSYGIKEEQIVNAGKLMEKLFDKQYFDLEEMPHEEEEVFADVGCFDGLTVRNFMKWSENKYKEIISFEPDRICFDKCKTLLKDVDNLSLINIGLWNSEGVLNFRETGVSDSMIAEDGEIQIRTACLDDIVKDKKVTFIKMDIEGAEKEAIIGAETTIRYQKPKMAISIYHKKQDIWEIPLLLLKMNPEYKFYIRHYSLREAETVLYAI